MTKEGKQLLLWLRGRRLSWCCGLARRYAPPIGYGDEVSAFIRIDPSTWWDYYEINDAGMKWLEDNGYPELEWRVKHKRTRGWSRDPVVDRTESGTAPNEKPSVTPVSSVTEGLS